MKKSKPTRGLIVIIIGGALAVFGGIALPFVILFAFPKSGEALGDWMLYNMFVHFAVGAIVALIGYAMAQKPDQKNVFRCLTAFHYCVLALIISVAVELFALAKDNEEMSGLVMLIQLPLVIATIIIGVKKRKKYGPQPPQFIIHLYYCDGCKKQMRYQGNLIDHRGKHYCSACYQAQLAQEQEKIEAEKAQLNKQKPCSVCGRELPPSSMNLVNDQLICEDCFETMFPADLS